MSLIKELIDLPEHVHRGDFVLRLTEGVEKPADTLRDIRAANTLPTRPAIVRSAAPSAMSTQGTTTTTSACLPKPLPAFAVSSA